MTQSTTHSRLLPEGYKLKFYARGKQYEIRPDYIFVDNGACIQYGDPHMIGKQVIVPKTEWVQIKPFLKQVQPERAYLVPVKCYSI